MAQFINSLEVLVSVFSKLWNVLFTSIGGLIDQSTWISDFVKGLLLRGGMGAYPIIPIEIQNLSIFGLFSIGFITFIILFSFIKLFTNIL